MPLKSFIEIPADSHFPLENLPFGIFGTRTGLSRVGVAVGEYVVDLTALEQAGHLRCPETEDRHLFSRDSLNAFLTRGRTAWKQIREALQHLLSAETPTLRDDAALRERVFHRQRDVMMKLPARIGNYTDFYSSYHH